MNLTPVAHGRIEPEHPGGRPIEWAATGRSGGVSRGPYSSLNLADHVQDDARSVARNRALLVDLLHLPAGRLALMSPVHGAGVSVVRGPGVSAECDALVTQESELALAALGADCVPVALLGSDGRTIAVAHCGWRGLAADVVGATVAAMRDLGADVRQAVLGPAVCGACYPVPPERVRQLVASVSPAVARAAVASAADGQPGIDVRAGVRRRLVELGVAPEAVLAVGGCTVEDPGLFSFRRDGVTGRQGIAVCTVGSSRGTPSGPTAQWVHDDGR